MKKSREWRKVVAHIHRKQFIRSNQVEINAKGEITKFITKDDEPNTDTVEKVEGEKQFVSYTVVLKPFDETMEKEDDDADDDDYNAEVKVGKLIEKKPERKLLQQSLIRLGVEPNEYNEYVFILRKYAKNKRRGSVRPQHSRLKSYLSGRRKLVTVRENKGPSWSGVFCLVFGLFTLLISIILGQFWEEDNRPHVKRRLRQQNQMKQNANIFGTSGYSSGIVRARNSTITRRR